MSTEENPNPSSVVRLDVGGKIFRTTVGTFTNREPHSMLAAMFSSSHNLHQDENGAVFIDRDGKQFRHILNWLRDGKVPTLLENSVYEELLREAEYYQLVGLMDGVQDVLNKNKGEEDKPCPDLTRAGVIDKYLKNLHGLDLSYLDLSGMDFTYAYVRSTLFSYAKLSGAKFTKAYAEGAIFDNAELRGSCMCDADLAGASFVGAELRGSCMCDADLAGASFVGADLQGAIFRGAVLNGCSFEEAYMKGACFYHGDMPTVNLKGAFEVDSIIVTRKGWN